MRLTLSFERQVPLPAITLAQWKKIVTLTCCETFPLVFRGSLSVTLSVVSVPEKGMAILNKRYRKKNQSTDVLSFGNLTNTKGFKKFSGKYVDLGELILAPDYIRRSAKEDGVSWKHELVFVFIHGILHLLGHDHSKEMFRLQDELTAKSMRLLHSH